MLEPTKPKCYGSRSTQMDECYSCSFIEPCSKDTLSKYLNGKAVRIIGP